MVRCFGERCRPGVLCGTGRRVTAKARRLGFTTGLNTPVTTASPSEALGLGTINEKGREMPQYLTRVELHQADASDYQRLHEAMAVKKFSRTIPNDNGIRYHLPTAEYYSYGEIDTGSVLGLATQAVQSIGKAASVITVNWTGAMWSGLPAA
jgi:hypothetical protein